MPFRALRVAETEPGKFERSFIEMNIEDLPPGELLIKVQYSSLNYKDAMSATGNKGITRKFPHTPGIDAAGVVELSRHEAFAVHDEVIATGHDLGMNTDGAFGEYIRIPASWAMLRPSGFRLSETMIIGTAGLTAAAGVHKMQLVGQKPSMGPVVVTGSTGGVGSMAVAILAKAGYEVIAVTGKADAKEYLTHLGASRIENRDFVNDTSNKNLLKSKWAGAIDTVGGNTLVTLLKGCSNEGSVVSTGLVGSFKLDATVYPFILNGINLLGIGSAETDPATKALLWAKLASEWNVSEKFSVIAKEVSLDEVHQTYIDAMLQGKLMGRILIKM